MTAAQRKALLQEVKEQIEEEADGIYVGSAASAAAQQAQPKVSCSELGSGWCGWRLGALVEMRGPGPATGVLATGFCEAAGAPAAFFATE